MIKTMIWALMMFTISIHSQNFGNEWKCMLLSTSLRNQKVTDERPLLVTFDFEIPKSLKEDILASELLNKEEKIVLLDNDEFNKPKSCPMIRTILIEKQVLNVPGDYIKYDKVGYSLPFKGLDDDAFLIYERTLVDKKNHISGGVILENYKKVNGSWKMEKRKLLESY